MMEIPAGDSRPPGAQESAGLATGDEYRFADGHKVGEVVYRFGARDTVTRDMPGWFVADGTQPDLIVAGVNYGKPDLRGRFLVGANDDLGGGGTFPVGATGGSSNLSAHTHAFTQPNNHVFTQPSAHVITQPVFAGPPAHVITQPVFGAPTAHTITQPVVANHAALGTHAHALPFAKTSGGTGTFWIIPSSTYGVDGSTPATESTLAPSSSGGTAVFPMLSSAVSAGTPAAHSLSTNVALSNNHDAPARTTDVALTNNPHPDPVRTVDVALSNNHSGGAVDPHAGGAVGAVVGTVAQIPPYYAVWPLIKVR